MHRPRLWRPVSRSQLNSWKAIKWNITLRTKILTTIFYHKNVIFYVQHMRGYRDFLRGGGGGRGVSKRYLSLPGGGGVRACPDPRPPFRRQFTSFKFFTELYSFCQNHTTDSMQLCIFVIINNQISILTEFHYISMKTSFIKKLKINGCYCVTMEKKYINISLWQVFSFFNQI